jgi:hypothetical protein
MSSNQLLAVVASAISKRLMYAAAMCPLNRLPPAVSGRDEHRERRSR